MADEPEYRRVQRLVEMRHALVRAIDRKTALNQVVRADGQKIASAASRSAVNAAEGTSIMTPTWSGPEATPLASISWRASAQDAACLAQLFDPRHEWEHHAQIAVRRRPHQRAQLRPEAARGVSA